MGACFENKNTVKNRKIYPLKECCEIEPPNNNKKMREPSIPKSFELNAPNINKKMRENHLYQKALS